MKKRIISLILVAVMTLLALCSCSFNYEKRDLSKYTTFNSTEFEKALLELVIADADFGVDETTRKTKVRDTIFAALANDYGTDNKVLTGAAGQYDVVYYGFYVTATKDVTEKDADGKDVTTKVTYTLMNDSMNPAKPGSVQIGLLANEGLAKLIETLVAGKDIGDFVYSASAEGTTASGDTVYLSYTRTYSVPKLDADGNPELDAEQKPLYESKTETVNYGIVTLPEVAVSEPETQADESTDDNTETKPEVVLPFLDSLVGKKVGKVSDYKVKETIDGEEYEVSYTGINIHWIVENEGKEIGTVEDKTYTATKKVKDVNGVEVDLKDLTLTYHVFPMYIVDLPTELNAEIVLKKLLGTDTDKDGTVEDSEKGTLEIFASETYKNGEDTVKALIEKLTTAYNELAKANKTYTTEKDKADKDTTTTTKAADESTEDKESTEEKEPTALEKAEAALEEKQKAVDELVDKLLHATDGTLTFDIVLPIEYSDAVYENLENSYISAIKTNIAKEVFKLAEKYVTFGDKLPKSAVKDAYERIENVHKYNFYQGNYKSSSSTTGSTSTTPTVTNYEFYDGNYEAYLKIALGLKSTDNMDMAEKTMMKQAEDAVKELLVIYTLADYYGDDVALTKEQKKSVKNNIYVVYLGVSEDDLLHSMQWDNVVNHILELGEEVEGDNTVYFKNIKYTFEVEDEESEGGESTEGDHDHDHDH